MKTAAPHQPDDHHQGLVGSRPAPDPLNPANRHKPPQASSRARHQAQHEAAHGSIPRLAITLAALLFSALPPTGANANPCLPNDPDGSNPGNLCLSYPPTGIGPQFFVQGQGQPALYGPPLSPTQPGRVVGHTSGYWTGIQASNGSTTLQDSQGQVISIPASATGSPLP